MSLFLTWRFTSTSVCSCHHKCHPYWIWICQCQCVPILWGIFIYFKHFDALTVDLSPFNFSFIYKWVSRSGYMLGKARERVYGKVESEMSNLFPYLCQMTIVISNDCLEICMQRAWALPESCAWFFYNCNNLIYSAWFHSEFANHQIWFTENTLEISFH